MKLLGENECVQLLEASEADRTLLARRMAECMEPRTAAWFEKEVHNKNLNVTTVFDRNGQKLCAIWWWYSPTNQSLVLNAGASFVNTNTTPAFLEAYELLAKHVGAKTMEFVTTRPGVIRIYQKEGWTVDGVLMRKLI